MLGVLLRRSRERLGLTQQAVAKAAGVSRPTVANIERGQGTPSLGVLARIARAVSVDATELGEALLCDAADAAGIHPAASA